MPAVGQARGGHPRPFVGREQEPALLRYLLREAGTGPPAVVVVSGVPGAGKTALLHWVGDTAATAGAFVLRSSGSEGMVAFDALRRLLAPLPELATLLDRDASEDVPVVGGDHAGRIGTEIADALAALDYTGARTPLHLLVVLDAREPVPDGSLAARALRLDAGRSLPVGGFDAQDIRDMLASSGQGASRHACASCWRCSRARGEGHPSHRPGGAVHPARARPRPARAPAARARPRAGGLTAPGPAAAAAGPCAQVMLRCG
jgi:hypothetical protein